MKHDFGVAVLLCCVVATANAQELTKQPYISDPYEVANARAAMDEIMARDDAAEALDQERFNRGETTLENFVSVQPVFQAVSWPDEDCTDLVSLFPSPPEGWAIWSDWGQYENPIGEERAELFYQFVPDLPRDDPNWNSVQATVAVRVYANAPQGQLWDMRMENEVMREASFDPGPFNYPVMKFLNATMLGDYYIEVSGQGEDDPNADMFFEQIIGCAIDSGLLANGVDPATLTR